MRAILQTGGNLRAMWQALFTPFPRAVTRYRAASLRIMSQSESANHVAIGQAISHVQSAENIAPLRVSSATAGHYALPVFTTRRCLMLARLAVYLYLAVDNRTAVHARTAAVLSVKYAYRQLL